MLREFIAANRSELIDRCRARVAQRRSPRPTDRELTHGIPTFVEQLERMLDTPQPSDGAASIESSASRHGGDLLRGDFTIEQVVFDYGDLCQAITQLATERNEPISVPEFSVLNLRLDSAIASAVGEWSRKREISLDRMHEAKLNERLGFLGHEMRNQLNTAILALSAIKTGGVGFGGATAAALDRSMLGMKDLIDRALSDARLQAADTMPLSREPIEVASFMHEVQVTGALEASALGCHLSVTYVDAGVMIEGDRQLLAAALANILQNAFKFTRKNGHVHFSGRVQSGHVLLSVEDECGGLPPGAQQMIFRPFRQAGVDRSGIGLGLAISQKGVEENGGTLTVRDNPGKGCVFTIDLPRA